MNKNWIKNLGYTLLLAILGAILGLFLVGQSQGEVRASTVIKPVLDTSEWQGDFTASQAKALKGEVSFMIVRAQYGSEKEDSTFVHNASLLSKYDVPYGAYSFSCYTSASDAKNEAKTLYKRAPNAKFYVNDFEVNYVTSGSTNTATKAWYTEMKKLTNKPIVFYSYRSFQQSYAPTAYKSYDAYWLASYSTTKPSPYNYALWQDKDNYYSSSLGLSVDHSKLITSVHPVSWWIGTKSASQSSTSKYYSGGLSTKETVRINSGVATWDEGSNSTSKVDSTVLNRNYTIKQVKKVTKGHSNQEVLLYYKGQPMGWMLAEHLTPYYSSSKVKSVKVINKKGIKTYLGNTAVNTYKKGSVLDVDGYTTRNGYPKFIHKGHKTTFTANKNFVKMVTKKATSSTSKAKKSSKSTSKHTYYTIKSGDSFWSISQKYGLSMSGLASKNGLTINSTIYPGQKLLIK